MRPTEPIRIAPTAAAPITSWDFGAGGSAHLVLAVHDFTANGLWFGDLAGACGPEVRVVAPDLRGRAASVTAPEAATLDDHIADLLGLADRTGASTFSIVGHGTGAMLALSVAAATPQRVTRVVVLDGPPTIENDPDTDWTGAATRIDPGITRVRRTWAHRDAAIADGGGSGRIPASGMSRSLRRAVDAETTGSGFGWRPRLAATSLARDWALLEAWSPPSGVAASVTSFAATHGHRVDEPPIELWNLGTTTALLDTTHSGVLVDRPAVRVVVDSVAGRS